MKQIGIILLVFSGYCFSQEVVESDSLLLWRKDRPLKWTDFRGDPKPVKIHNEAGTGMTIHYTSNYNIYGEIEINPLCYFQKCRSWTKTEDSAILEHEQLHFDIQELYTRKIRKLFIKHQEKEEQNIDVYTSSADSILLNCQSIQNQYDSEALVNYTKFLEWRTKITKELDELMEYEYIPEE